MLELYPDGTYGKVVTKTWKHKPSSTTTTSEATSSSPAKKMKYGDENDLLVVQKVTKQKVRTPTIKNVARKSTSKPGSDYGFSFYGTKPDYGDLKKITTTMTINNIDVTRTVDQFSYIFNLYPNVVLEDCMKVKKTDTS